MNVLLLAVNISEGTKNGSNAVYLKRFLSSISKEKISNYTLLVCSEGYNILKPLFPDIRYELYEVNPKFMSLRHWKITKKEAYKFRQYVNTHNYDCIFITHYFAFFARLKFKCRKVVVIHDIISLHNIKFSINSLKEYLFFYYYFKCQLKTSDKIIAISDYVKKDILKVYDKKWNSKIIVIHNCVEICKLSIKPQNFNYEKYILFVGRPASYKGFITALKAYRELKRNEYKLVFVSSNVGYWITDVKPYIDENRLENDIVQLTNVSEENLKWLYENAMLFITPSEHEGFGYTPIEAAICCCPVISSKCDSLPEVTQGLVNYYEPVNNYINLSKKMAYILDNPPSREELRNISDKLKKSYAPLSQANQIIKILFSEQ